MSRKLPVPFDWLYQGLIVSAIWKAAEVLVKRFGRLVLRKVDSTYANSMFYLNRFAFLNVSLLLLVIWKRLRLKGTFPMFMLMMTTGRLANWEGRRGGSAPTITDREYYSPSAGVGMFLVDPSSPQVYFAGRVPDESQPLILALDPDSSRLRWGLPAKTLVGPDEVME